MQAYAECLRQRHVKHLVTTNIIGRLPNGMGPLVVALFLRSQGFDYATVGVLTALYGVAAAVGGPVLGRFVDLHGQARILLISMAASTLGFLLLSMTGPQQAMLAAASITLAGLFTPPLEPCLRSLWPRVLNSSRSVNAAYALDAALQEIIFVAGPLLVIGFVNTLGTQGAVIMTGLVAMVGTLGFVAAPPVRIWRSEPRQADWAGPLRSGSLRRLLLGFLFVGSTIGLLNIAVVAYSEAEQSTALSGLILGANALGALIGGLAYGMRSWAGSAHARLTWLLLGLAIGYLPLAFTPPPGLILPLAVLSGLCLAPALACAFAVVGDVVPTGTITEAFAWLITIFMMGNAIGNSIGGAMVENWALSVAFTAPTITAFAGYLALATSQTFRTPLGRMGSRSATG